MFRDISFLEWFLLGMPWELVVVTVLVGGTVLLVGTVVDALRRRTRRDDDGDLR